MFIDYKKFISLIIIFMIILVFFRNSTSIAKQFEGKIYFERENDIWTINPDGTSKIRLTKSGNFFSPVLSPDGNKIVFVADAQTGINDYKFGKLGIVNSDGTNIKTISNYSYSDINKAQWFSDSRKFRCGKDIFDINGKKTYEITVSGYEIKHSPDGTKIVYATYVTGNPRVTVCTCKIDGSNTQEIFTYDIPPSETLYLTTLWDSSSKQLAVSGQGQLWYVNFVNDTKNYTKNFGYPQAWTPDGEKIIYSFNGTYIINSDGTDRTLLYQKNSFNICWSPDYTRFLYFDGKDLWIYNLKTKESNKLVDNSTPLGWVK